MSVKYEAPDQCCFVDEHGNRCAAEATFWIGTTFLDYSHACGDHARDVRTGEQVIIRLVDGEVMR